MTILSAFHVWLPANATNFAPNLYNDLPWGAGGCIGYNYGGHFQNGGWTPPAGFVLISSSVRVTNALELYQVISTKLTKDALASDTLSRTAVGCKGNYEGMGQRDSVYVCHTPGSQNFASGSETFKLKLYTSDPAVVADCNPAHTHWSGVCMDLPFGL
jgi:hypothetical protein